MAAIVTKTAKKGESILFEGRSYRIALTRVDGTILWRCRKKPQGKCCTGRGEKRGVDGFLVTTAHSNTCMPDVTGQEALKRKADMKADALAHPAKSSKRIYEDALLGATEDVVAKVQVFNTQKRGLDRWKVPDVPVAPDDKANWVIPAIFDNTITGNRRWRGYTAPGNSVVMFGSDRDLLRLAAADRWLSDGLHSIPLYEQVYVIGSMDDGVFLPAILVCTVNKNTATYLTIFQELKAWAARLGVVLAPTELRIDFEMAVRNAAAAEFQATQISGCQFHHADAIWTWINRHGLAQDYEQIDDFRKVCKELMVVCFLPAADIAQGVDLLEANCPPAVRPQFLRVLAYYRRYWLGIWGPDAICHYNDYQRTNNDVESTNRVLRRDIGRDLRNVNMLIQILHRLEGATNTKLIQLQAHPGEFIVARNKMYAHVNKQIGTCFDQYGRGEVVISRYLARLAHLSNPTFFDILRQAAQQ